MKIRVIIAQPGEAPVVQEIKDDLTAMQKVVGGYIECVSIGDLDFFVNEEGLLRGLPFNRVVGGVPLVGPILVTASDEDGNTLGLTDEQVTDAMGLLAGVSGTA